MVQKEKISSIKRIYERKRFANNVKKTGQVSGKTTVLGLFATSPNFMI